MRTKLEILRCTRSTSGAALWNLEGYRCDPHPDAATAVARSIDQLGAMGRIVLQVIELPNDNLPANIGLLVQE